MITTKHIIAVYNLATPSEVEHGMTWYSNALAILKEMSQDFEMPTHIVVGVMSALSPNNKYERNLENTYALIRAFLMGQDMDSVKVSTYHTMKRKAWHILARNIYYNDRQGLTTPNTNIRKLEYLDIQKAYQRASKKLGIKAYELQAITWVAWKRIHNI